MDVRQLEHFVAVADARSFTRAAAAVHVTQSGVSAQVRALEAALGHVLFDRSARPVRLTPAGEALIEPARRAVSALRVVREAAEDIAGLVRGSVRVATIAGGAPDHVYAALAAFRRLHPGVQLALSEGVSRELVRRVDAGDLDVAVVGAAGRWSPARPSVVITDDALVAVMAHGHRLARRRSLNATHLQGEALICMPRGTGIRDALDAAWPASPEVALEVSTPAVIRTLAADGLGVGILAASMTIDPRRLVTVPLAHPRARSRLELIWGSTPGGNPAARALVAHLRNALRAPSEDAGAREPPAS